MLANAQEKVAKNRCISLAKKHFPEAANGHDLIDIFTIVVAPDQLHKKEIHSKSFKVTIWDDFIKRYNLPKTLSSNMLIKELKIARTVDTSDDLSLTKDYPQWNALFQGKNPNSKALLSALLSGAAYGTMRKNLSESEVIEALETLRNIEIDSL
jgi:hypothetical protein